MQHKNVFLASLLLISGTALAEIPLAGGIAKQAATNALTGAVPSAVPGAANAVEAAGAAGQAQKAVQTAPGVLKDQAQETAKETAQQKVEQAVPAEVKQGAETVTDLKGKVDAAPKSAGEATAVVKDRAKQKAAGKALDLLK
ncbi:hypothetical protein [Methylomonas sp. TEB]|uniref:hypothetical protein n=1 Tax=Methylomonas sp. TEB TaxID=3398229 RepID=UPI0039F45CE2